jgi:hypothetical protein
MHRQKEKYFVFFILVCVHSQALGMLFFCCFPKKKIWPQPTLSTITQVLQNQKPQHRSPDPISQQHVQPNQQTFHPRTHKGNHGYTDINLRYEVLLKAIKKEIEENLQTTHSSPTPSPVTPSTTPQEQLSMSQDSDQDGDIQPQRILIPEIPQKPAPSSSLSSDEDRDSNGSLTSPHEKLLETSYTLPTLIKPDTVGVRIFESDTTSSVRYEPNKNMLQKSQSDIHILDKSLKGAPLLTLQNPSAHHN